MVKRATKKLKPSMSMVSTDGRPTSVSFQHVGGHPRTAKLVDPDYLRCLREIAANVRLIAPTLPKMTKFGLNVRVLFTSQIAQLEALESAQDYWRTDSEIQALSRVDDISEAWSRRDASVLPRKKGK